MEITASICLAFKRSGSPPLKWHLNGGLFDHLNTELTSLVCRSPLLFVIRIQPVHISMKKNISSFMSSLDYTKLCPINLKTGNSKTGILIVRILNGHPIPRLGQPFKHWLYRNKIFILLFHCSTHTHNQYFNCKRYSTRTVERSGGSPYLTEL